MAGKDAVQVLARTPFDAVGKPAKNKAFKPFFDGLLRSSEQRLKHELFLGDKLVAAESMHFST